MNAKITTLALMLFICIISVSAQITWNAGSFTCSVPDTNVVCNTNSTCTLACTIINTDCCLSVNCNQFIDSIFSLPMGWYVTMCNPNGCFSSSTTQNAFIIPPSDSATAIFEIHAGSNTGNANVRVGFLDNAVSSNSITFHIVGSTITGIASVENSNLSLSQNFPNPFSTSTTIKYNLDSPNGHLIITDIQGKTISEYKLSNTTGEVILTENLKTGIYFSSLYSNNKMISKNKMLVQ